MNAAPLLLLACVDILLPGHRSVRSEIVLEVPPALAAWQFVVAPQPGFEAALVEGTRPTVISAKYGSRVWAFPAGSVVPARFDERAWEQHSVSKIPLGAIDQLAASDPTRVRRVTFRVLGVGDREVRLELVKTELLDSEGHPVRSATMLLTLSALALVGAFGLIVLARRR
jgi:hypothetical protein